MNCDLLRVRIPGEPCAQGRPRAFRLPNGQIRAFDPEKSRSWKAEARHSIAREIGTGIILIPFGPCEVEIDAVFTCPRSDWRKLPVGRRPHPKKPDGENVAKAVLDAAEGLVYTNDSQVAVLTIRKWIGAQEESPYVELVVGRP